MKQICLALTPAEILEFLVFKSLRKWELWNIWSPWRKTQYFRTRWVFCNGFPGDVSIKDVRETLDPRITSRKKKWIMVCPGLLSQAFSMLRNGLPLISVTVKDGTELILLNNRYPPKAKNMPDDALNFSEGFDVSLASVYSLLGNFDSIVQHAIRSDFKPSDAHLRLRSPLSPQIQTPTRD